MSPETFAATVFWNPCILPPAAKKHPHATIAAQTDSWATTPTAMYVQTAISTPMLTASAISMSIRPSLLRRIEATTAPARTQGECSRGAGPAHCCHGAPRPLLDICEGTREDTGAAPNTP